jgi:predicted AAA+ superfamily ATPase
MLENSTMRGIGRSIEPTVRRAARAFPAVILTGPRRSGKTWLLRHLWPDASYWLFEDPTVVARFRADPEGFLDAIETPVILDEIQNVPEVFAHVRARIDAAPSRKGQWLITGSQEAGLMRNVTESMTGRAAILQLLPLSASETAKVSPFLGGYPEALARPRDAALWFSSYVQTYLERDVRSISAIHDLATFRRFLGLVATRTGQMLNRSDLAAPLGVSIPSISRWLDILETTGQILLVPPYFENVGKRIVKSPKLYVTDSGLARFLLGIETAAELARSPFQGALFEGFVAAEIVKGQINAGRRKELYYFRDQQGLEVDFVVPSKGASLELVEVKASRTIRPEMARPLLRLAEAFRASGSRSTIDMTIVHQPSSVRSTAVAPGVRAVAWTDYFATEGRVTAARR